jgi:hypothetical protein
MPKQAVVNSVYIAGLFFELPESPGYTPVWERRELVEPTHVRRRVLLRKDVVQRVRLVKNLP